MSRKLNWRRPGALPHRVAWSGLAIAMIVGSAACDRIAGGDPSAPPASASPAPAAPSSGAPTAAPATAAPAQPPADGEVLASRDVQADGHDLTIDITGLRRQGEAATLQWRITVTTAGETGSWYMGQTLGSGTNDYTVSGVTLVDPVNGQRYLVARSGGEDGECACTQETNIFLSQGDTAEFFATYAAPPPDITTINVEFPRFGAFTDVPVT